MSWVTRIAKTTYEAAKYIAGYPNPEKYPSKATAYLEEKLSIFKERVYIWREGAESRNETLNARIDIKSFDEKSAKINEAIILLYQDYGQKPQTYQNLKNFWGERLYSAKLLKDLIIKSETDKDPAKLIYIKDAFDDLEHEYNRFAKNIVPEKAQTESMPR